MGILDIFNGFAGVKAPDAAQPQPTTTQTALPADPSKTNPLTPGAGTTKSDGSVAAFPAAGTGDQSPLAGFEKMWETADTDLKKTTLTPNMKVDPKTLTAAAANIDFKPLVNPELATKALAGDQAALGELLNSFGQGLYAQQAASTVKIVETAMNAQEKRFNEVVLPQKLKEHSTSASLRADNPLFNNPAVAPVLNMVEQQLQIKNPTASAEQISKLAKDFVSQMGLAIVTGDGKIVGDKPIEVANPKVTDWSTFG